MKNHTTKSQFLLTSIFLLVSFFSNFSFAAAPWITTQPQSKTVMVGQSVSFSVIVTGSATPLTYQWYLNNVAVSGATSSTLSFSSVKTSDAGSYNVLVRNASGAASSSYAKLTVNSPPSITTQPKSQTAALGASVSFSVVATGTATLAYQWKLNGTSISGATSSTYAISSVASASAGNYTVVVSNAYGSATSSAAALSLATNANTVGKTYYVSPSGNDNNSGLSASAAWQTVSKVNNTTFAAGDWVLFQGGQSFTGCLSLSPSKIPTSSDKPFKVGAYGTGKFTLTANCSGDKVAAVNVSSLNGFILENAKIVGNSGGAQYGVFLHNKSNVTSGNMTVQNCEITGFYAPATTNFGAEIFISGLEGALTNVNILNNSLHGSSVSSLDDNGVAGYGNGKNIKNVVYRGNQVYNIGGKANGVNGSEGNGILANGVDGGLMEHNVVHDIGGNVNTCGGAAGLWAYNSNNITIQYNESYYVRPITFTKGCDWDGYDLDGSVTNSVVQYNYSHDNFGAGYLAYSAGTWGPNVYRYNLSINDALGPIAFGAFSMSNGGGAADVRVYNNTFYSTDRHASGIVFTNGSAETGYIVNNIFYMGLNTYKIATFLNSNGKKPAGIVIDHNAYFANVGSGGWLFNYAGGYYGLPAWQATGHDAHSLAVNPQISAAGSVPLCNGYSATCATDYILAASSPLIGVGADLTQAPYNFSIGTKDFWGNTIKHTVGTGYNIGAYGGR